MQLTDTHNTTAAIWTRLLRPDKGTMSPEAAHFFLDLAFDRHDLDRMHQLAAKNQAGKLTPAEHDELKTYRQVGLELDLLRAKAKLALKQHAPGH